MWEAAGGRGQGEGRVEKGGGRVNEAAAPGSLRAGPWGACVLVGGTEHAYQRIGSK